MPKTIFYAMDADYLRKYAEFKDKISLEQIKLSSDEIKRISAEIQAARSESRELYSIDDDGIAHISVAGPLEPKPDPCAIMFDIDMTTYSDIILAVRQAESDESVKSVTFDFDTPGGNVTGLFATADVIRKMEKPTLAVNHGLMASAGYALASQCKRIEAVNLSAETGSIGVVTEIVDYSGADEGRGVKRYVLTSENAENKRPDVTKQEGRDKIISRLTALENVFIEYVAAGRNATTEAITDNFGHGAVFAAREALKLGMIDSIQSDLNNPAGRNATTAEEIAENHSKGENAMEMTQEELDKIIEDTATKTASAVRSEFEAKEQKDKAESERKAGFTVLLSSYPNQKAMIEEEMKKEGATASADFTLKVVNAEKARVAAEQELSDGEEENPETHGNDENSGSDDQSGNALAAARGLKVGE